MEETKFKEIILIDKPKGISSYKAISNIKWIFKKNGYKKIKIGHAGTLDPLATGLLVIGITRAGTKRLGTLINQDKTYICDIDLLKDSESGDMENYKQMLETKDVEMKEIPSLELIQELIETKFTGEIEQTPPQHSALKINGKKACDLARKGIKVEMKSRKITIHEIEVLEYEFPVLKLQVKCSKGTYIRTLGKDIGKELGFYGTLLDLRRIQSGGFSIDNALTLEDLNFNFLAKTD